MLWCRTPSPKSPTVCSNLLTEKTPACERTTNIDAICMWMFKNPQDYKVNPIAMLLTSKLMLDWLRETDMATRLESAIARVIKEGKVRTYDMGGNASTLDMAKAVADYAR